MEYYIVIFVFLLLGAFLNNILRHTSYRSLKVFLHLIVFLSLVVFKSFIVPESVPDLSGYKESFLEFRMYDWKTAIQNSQGDAKEQGFLLFTKLLGIASSNFVVELFVIALIVTAAYYFFLMKYSDEIWVSLLMYFFYVFPKSSYIIRQYLAMAILLFAVKFILDKRLLPFFFIVVLASTMHRVSLLWLPVFFLYQIKNKKAFLWIIIGVMAVIYVALQELALVLNSLGGDFLRYGSYLNDESSVNYTGFFIMAFYLLLFVYFGRGRVFEEGVNRLVLIFLVLSAYLSFLRVGTFPLLFRVEAYFSQMIILAVPRILRFIKEKNKRLVVLIGIVVVESYRFLKSDGDFTDSIVSASGIFNILCVCIVAVLFFCFCTYLSQKRQNRGNKLLIVNN